MTVGIVQGRSECRPGEKTFAIGAYIGATYIRAGALGCFEEANRGRGSALAVVENKHDIARFARYETIRRWVIEWSLSDNADVIM